ncbi:CLOCK-interacting pacemaker-like [Misgurnus anguillicaudatus]|uniref:CLOCK-interacting pacemaker-like n=1 Tax=Misgurnus anguillicaudatus TaxID=75329 RepID=UPI003CCF118B
MGNKRKTSSEIDKYSDASSGYFSALDQTDYEDVGPTTAAPQSMQTASQIPFIPGSHSSVSPMIIMNNLVLKQPNSAAPALKPWSLKPSLDVVPQSQLLFLQPVTSQNSDNQKNSWTCAPMQNTLPKIAPYHSNGTNAYLGPNAASKKSNHSERHQRHRHDDRLFHRLKQDETFKNYDEHHSDVSWGEFSHSATDVDVEDSRSGFSDSEEPHTTSTPLFLCSDSVLSSYPQKCSKATFNQTDDEENISEALSPSTSKRKRFCNTYNILNRSGLLGITLRTKELMRQNKRSQAQLRSLQAQTDLFLEAMGTGDPKVWTKLQLTFQNLGGREETALDFVRDVDSDIKVSGCMM